MNTHPPAQARRGLLRRACDLVFYRHPAAFHSPLPVAEAIGKLDQAVLPSWSSFETGVMGRVRKRVDLKRAIPLLGNPFASRFFGRFEQAGDGSVLRGAFRLTWGMRLLVCLLLLAGVACTVMALVPAPGRPGRVTELMLVAGPLLVVLVLVALAIGRWLARDDESIVTLLVERTLQAPRDVAPGTGAS